MNRRQRQRTLGRMAVVAATVGSAAGLGAGVAGLPHAAAAVSAGVAEIVTPTGSAPLTSGGSATDFRVKLPTGAACTGDSANDGYRIQSYLVPQAVALDTLKFDSSGPVPVTGEFRRPLFDTASDPYVDQLTATAIPAPGPGPIIQPLALPFNFAVFNTTTDRLTPGVYNVGIACTKGPPGSATQLDKYWNALLTIAADPADTGPAKVKFTVSAAAPTTTITLVVGPATSAALGAEVTLTATVAPAGATGSVTFKDGTTTIGAPVTVANGVATLKKTDLTSGAHSFTASFAPAVAGAFTPSTSASAAFTITAAGATTTTTAGSSTSTTAGSSTSTTAGSSTTSTTSGSGSVLGSGTSSGSSGARAVTGATAASSGKATNLPKTGGTFLPILAWSFVLLCLGRAAVLVGRTPSRRTSKP